MTLATSLLLLLAAQTNPFEQGLEAYSKGDYARAEPHLREAVSRQADPRARTFLALTLAATSRCDAALPDLRAAFDATPSATQRLAGLALVQCGIAAARFDDAEAAVSRLRKQYPKDADVLYLAARLHMRAWNDALFALYQSDPASYRVNQISGEILETQGQFPAAAAEYRKALAKNPQALNLHFRLGRALLLSAHSAENLEAARAEFEAELARNPLDAVTYYQLGQILLAQNRTSEAGARFERALALQPGFPEALIALGKLRLEQKQTDDAIRLLTRAAQLLPASEAAHYNLMLAYRNAGRGDDARREKATLDALQKPKEGEFSDFLKKLGEK